MIQIVLHRVLVELEDLKRKHEVDTPYGKKSIELAYGDMEGRLQASTTEGTVVSIGETAFRDYGYTESPVKLGDKVIFAKYAGKPVFDPDAPEKKLAVLNDEDVIAIIKSKEKTYE
jgi:co-chaperonin GroES (HSP10)